ncbi:hypothetical protein SMACR_00675 [Sordaria macrospora]|uniref:WGS project CABT00000000 data, contig 2.2 n=2 Tax=Sordaria macrospora TaxID=5147 RepID=F7VMS1_SORMK|nr:uncharacterized protein SMAC_00675 [Sordaria macrospora k-hell]KAA8633902.1 hypothetical protein SMACR_00675 [Sordaria macrospora]WPJ66865.1 hypothetical protein SMAC4_00675 [Sordaria macrospora]CCC06650.1 unnamed protein product [Sordaria macrospora k-hell]
MEPLAQKLDHLSITSQPSHPSTSSSSSSLSSIPAWILSCFAARDRAAFAAADNKHENHDDQMEIDSHPYHPPSLPKNTVFNHSSSGSSTEFTDAVWGRVFNHRRDYSLTPHVHAVVRPRSVAEVIAAVSYAKVTGKRVSVRSGGHSWAAWSVRGDAVLVDLCELGLSDGLPSLREGHGHHGHHGAYGQTEELVKDADQRGPAEACVWYDEESEVVACPPAMTGRELNDFLAEKGRMFAGGHCPDVGLGGFLLQGGMGWNCKNWGWACESVISMEVVTADGQHLLINNDSHPDLFWAARGAGPGFPAIVTRFYLLTRPLMEMYQSLYFYPVSLFKKVLQWEINIAPTCDPGMEIVCVSTHLRSNPNPTDTNPNSNPSPEPKDYDPEPTILASFTLFTTSRSAALAALQPIHDLHPPGTKHLIFCQPTSLTQEYTQQLLANPEGHRYCSDNAYIASDLSSSSPTTSPPSELSEVFGASSSGFHDHEQGAAALSVPDVLEKAFTTLPTVQSSALWFSMNPRSRHPLLDPQGQPMALSMQSDHYFAVYTVWSDPRDDERCTGWVKDVFKGLVEKREAVLVGSYLGDADFRVRRARFWSDECAKRLKEVRKVWDGEGRMGGFCEDKEGNDRVMDNGEGWV